MSVDYCGHEVFKDRVDLWFMEQGDDRKYITIAFTKDQLHDILIEMNNTGE